MNIIAHRGYWLKPHEKNSKVAFERAIEFGFGIETDFRDQNGKIVISHDVPLKETLNIDDFFKILKKNKNKHTIAINIKSDGLTSLISKLIKKNKISNYFVFDMSIPDSFNYINKRINTYIRYSEFENNDLFINQVKGVWLDSFKKRWFDKELIHDLLLKKKEICIVSDELHGRGNREKLWLFLKKNNFHESKLVSICTDYPMHAKRYFYD